MIKITLWFHRNFSSRQKWLNNNRQIITSIVATGIDNIHENYLFQMIREKSSDIFHFFLIIASDYSLVSRQFRF